MQFFYACAFTLVVLCCSGPLKRFNQELSYKHASKRPRVPAESSASASSASGASISSASSSSVVGNLFVSNKLSAKDAHAVQLANWYEGNEHATRY
jgi:hypothetical protein